MVVMVAMAVRPKVEVGGELHGAIWEAVRHPMLLWTLVVVGMGVVLVPGELVEALHTETLHLVASSLGRRLGFGHTGDHLGEDAAQNGLALGVWGVRRHGDIFGRMKNELDKFSFEHRKGSFQQ